MESICQEIGISYQHISETSVPDRFQLICDKQWLQILEQKRKICDFPRYAQLDRRAHPTGPLEHPWTRILVQVYRKQPQQRVFPLPRQSCRLYGATTTTDELGTALPDIGNLPLTYSQAVSYVANVNFRNLWEAAYRKYQAAHVKQFKAGTSASSTNASKSQLGSPPLQCNLLPYDVVLKELIQRIFNCAVIHCQLDRLREGSVDVASCTSDCHANVLPALVAIETSAHISVFFYPPAIITNLNDCITYSPALLSKSYNKPLFLIYQLFQLSRALQSMGLFLGDIRLHDILLRDNLWLQIIPDLEANMLRHSFEDCNNFATSPSEAATAASIDLATADAAADYEVADCDDYSSGNRYDLKFAYDLDRFTLREYCEMWCNGQLSNYDYLTILNNAAGRSIGNPAYHHIMPWVTDFAARNGTNWRDLSKSKYRLNKGDIHLDLMFSHAVNQHAQNTVSADQEVPHHVSDFLSDITYFVYMARRTAKHILCAHVRPIWVPAEYPVSMQRLQEWTPDECIPEFYSDPMVFKSIHEDLPDLELPVWASCPEDFINKHREALESQHVSECLQHWIDLNFGYKLTGKAAVKSKNVCLSMVDQHKNICQRGVVQLFSQPHPPKRYHSAWFSKTAPRLQHIYSTASRLKYSNNKHNHNTERDLQNVNKSIENLQIGAVTVTTVPAEIISKSSSIGTSPKSISRSQAACIESSALTSSSNFYQSTNFIELPKGYNPGSLLQSLETMQTFFARTFPKQKSTHSAQEKMATNDLLFAENSEDHSFTNQLFIDANPLPTPNAQQTKVKNLLVPCASYLKRRSLKQLLTEKRLRELQVMGCLIVELFATQRLRPLLMNGCNANFEERLQACRTAAELFKQEIPKCLRVMVRMLLQLDAQNLVSDQGLPATSSAQILEPIFYNTLIPFPNSYYTIYALIRALQAFDFDKMLLELHTHFSCNGKECSKYSEIDRQRVLFERKLAECKVMSCCAHIEHLLEPIAYEQFSAVELLLPHIIDLLTADQTSILTAWNLFDPVAQALGQANTQKYLLLPIMKLYDVESFDRAGGLFSVRNHMRPSSIISDGQQQRFSSSSSFKSRKSVKLYHHSFLLRVIVRFGLRCFLQHFIAPLIEAVGGYKEPEDSNGLHYHSNALEVESSSRRTSKNLNFINDDVENSITLMSPDVMETELDDATLSYDAPVTDPKQEMEDVFSFDDDAGSDRISNSGTAENKSIDSFEMRPTPAEEAKEDGENTALETSPEKLAISEIIYGQKISNASFDEADKISLNSQTGNDSQSTVPTPPATTTATTSTLLGPKSPTIAIPTSTFRRTYQLNAIDCDIGSRKSIDSFEIITQAVEEQEQQKKLKDEVDAATPSTTHQSTSQDAANDSLQASVISKMSEAKAVQNNRISEMSAESLIWLSHRLGPALTSRYITRNLLKMLSLCYVGQENLLPQTYDQEDATNLNYFSISDAKVVGDRSAARVLECLMSIAALFGEEIIILQYFPHISELIALCQRRITVSLEGAIISSLQLLKYLVPCLIDATIMERFKDLILDSIILPILRLLGSTCLLMPSGYLGRSVLARKLLDAVYALCVRIGPDMSKEHICIPALSQFFLIFDKAYGIAENFRYIHGDTESSTTAVKTGVSPPSYLFSDNENVANINEHAREKEELRDVFSPALAHTAYLAFLRFLGESIMQRTLYNLEFILTLCHEFEQPNYQRADSVTNRRGSYATDGDVAGADSVSDTQTLEPIAANSFGTNVIGNRLEVASLNASKQAKKQSVIGSMEVLDMVAYKFEQVPSTRHLKGNWLAYWRHEISRSDKDFSLNLKQIKLQSFAGHTNSVRAIVALDNENSFMSASKDKTVKLWSLRSEGDGKKTSSCQFTYSAHKKPIHSLAFLEAMRLVVSCDSGVHIWDPFIGRPLGILDSPKHNPVTVVKGLPAPSPLIVAGTAESSVRIIDTRCMQYVNEWRVSAASLGNATVRCLTVAPSGKWLGVGLSSGSIVMLDTRTGVLMNSWRPMEWDLLQLTAANDHQLISSALDHSLAVWHANDGILHYQLKPPPEPAHFLQTFGSELVFATTGNRIGIYADLSNSHAAYSVTKLRSETFRGVLTSLAVLPMNRTFLAGNESGNIVLLC